MVHMDWFKGKEYCSRNLQSCNGLLLLWQCKKVLDEDTSNELKKHANPINLGGDRLVDKGLILAYKLIWITTKGT